MLSEDYFETNGEIKSEKDGSLYPLTGLAYEGGSVVQQFESPYLVADKV